MKVDLYETRDEVCGQRVGFGSGQGELDLMLETVQLYCIVRPTMPDCSPRGGTIYQSLTRTHTATER